jgi:hypothetical protein
MFSKEMIDFLIKVISSWQIITVTIGLIVYIMLVSNVARTHRRAEFSLDSKPKKAKKEKPAAEALPADSGGDDLGLEEE